MTSIVAEKLKRPPPRTPSRDPGTKKAGRTEVQPARILGQGSYWYLMTSLPPWTWTLTKDSAGVMLR